MKRPSFSRLERSLGSMKAIMLEILILVVIVFLDAKLDPMHEFYAWVGILALVLLLFVSLLLYRKKMKKQQQGVMIDQVVDRLSEHLVDILATAWQEKWPALDEETVHDIEKDKDIKEVWTLTPDFEGVLGCKKNTIIENICCEEKKYKFIFPEKHHLQFDELLNACEADKCGKIDNVEGKCLLGRHITPIELVICFEYGEHHHPKPTKVYLYYDKGPNEKRVLIVKKDRQKYIGDLHRTYQQLWNLLSDAEHQHTMHYQHHH